MFRILLLIFLIVPVVEIYLLIQVGGILGAWTTIFLVVFTAVLGAWLLRIQGFSTLQRVQNSLTRGEIPAIEMLGGVLLLLSGALLLTPGFFTDAIGFLLLLPAFRHGLVLWFLSRGKVMRGGFGFKSQHFSSSNYSTDDSATYNASGNISQATDSTRGKGADKVTPAHARPHKPRIIEGEFREED